MSNQLYAPFMGNIPDWMMSALENISNDMKLALAKLEVMFKLGFSEAGPELFVAAFMVEETEAEREALRPFGGAAGCIAKVLETAEKRMKAGVKVWEGEPGFLDGLRPCPEAKMLIIIQF